MDEHFIKIHKWLYPASWLYGAVAVSYTHLLLEMSAPIQCKEVSNRSNNSEKFEKQRIEVSKIVQ